VDGTGREDQKRDEKESRPVEVTNDELRGFIDRAGVVDQTGAESLVVIMRHLLNEAYRAGREDTARDILAALRQREDAAHETYARRQALGVGDQAAEWAVRSRTWRQARQAAEEAAIARGDGVQPTEEQRARGEDQKRGEEQMDG
jgi:hypothetical protein